jgi:hypothetical protein
MDHPALTRVFDDVWQLEGAPLRMPGGARLPIRSTVVRLPDRSLVLYSPVKLADADAAAIDALGEVAHLVAPNRFHHLFLGAAAARWPRATVHGAPGLAAKRADLTFHRELGRDVEPAWQGALEVEAIAGVPRMSEVVIHHGPSGALICCDLVFHIGRPANFASRMAFGMMGVGGERLAQSRVWRLLRNDRAAARRSIERVLSWPIQGVVPTHGAAYVAPDAAVVLAGCMTRICGGAIALPATTS